MGKVRFTPGPWSIYMDNLDQFVVRKMYDDGQEAHVISRVRGSREVSASANARLIAAAPDLLAALEEVCDWIAGCLAADDSSMPDADMLRETERIATSARAAIAKATGEQP